MVCFKYIICDSISDHDLIYIIFNLLRKKTTPKLIPVRNYKNIDTNKVKQDLESVPWHVISIFDDVDDCLWCWQHMLKNVISDHVKTRKVKVKSNNQPWMNGEVRKVINNRYKLLLKARETPKNSKEWAEYRKARNRCTNLIRHAKATYWNDKFSSADCPKSFWSLVRKFKGVSSTPRIGPLKQNGVTITNDIDKANLMNSFFANIGKELATNILSKSSNQPLNSHIYRVTPTQSEIQLSKELLTKSFKSAVRIGKSCGLDDVTSNDLKLHEESSLTGLHEVVKCSVLSGKFPSEWKKAKVASIYKKGSKSNCSNYRPISLLSIPSKIVEHLICSQLNTYLTANSLLSEHQWGFRTQRSTEDAILYMTEKWREALDSGKVIGVLFIDFRKAFDSVSHEILLRKLSACGIAGDLHTYINNYLQNRSQITSLNGAISNLASVEYGVPQGSLIGPPCFSINVNDMPDCTECNLDQFADDSTAHTVGSSVDHVLTNIQKGANEIDRYSNKNLLTIHPDKCKVIIISKKRFVGPLMDIKIGGKSVEITRSSACLGISIDDRMKWDDHCQKVSKMFSLKVRKLFQMKDMPKSTLLTIYFQGILPAVLYGILIWGNCSQTLMNSIERTHVRAARFIFRLKKSTPDLAVLNTANWKPISYYYKRSVACKAYKIYYGLSSPLLSDLLQKSTRRATRNALKVDLLTFKYVDYKRSFRYRAAIVWNNLPNDLPELPSYNSFKSNLKKSDVLEKISFNLTGRALRSNDFIY